MLNRTTAPEFKQVESINFIRPEKKELDNGIKVFTINNGQQELIRLEFIFENVNWDASHPLQSVAVNGLINTGTSKLTAKEIADKVDYYGAFLQTEYSADLTNITLYSLNKYLPQVLPIVYAIISDAIFPKKELEIFKQNQKQKLQVNLKKNDFIARKNFAHAIFGDTPYGSDINLPHYDNLLQKELLSYYHVAYKPSNCTIFAAGKFTESEFTLLNSIFGNAWGNETAFKRDTFLFEGKVGEEIYIEKNDAVQSAIRMGNLSIDRNHADFPSLQILNCLFGGYFGSRLMANIREDKGYTYGIGSGLASLKHAGYFFIATEVGTEVCQSALNEIEKEIALLKTELPTSEELDLVRNFMLGSMLGSLENAFSHADKFKNIYFSGLDYDYYDRYINKVKTITPEEIKTMANKYLNWENMTRVVVGKK